MGTRLPPRSLGTPPRYPIILRLCLALLNLPDTPLPRCWVAYSVVTSSGVGYVPCVFRNDSQSFAADLPVHSAPLGAAQKAAQLQEDIPAAQPSFLSEKERYGNIFGLKNAPSSNGVGVIAPSPIPDANLAAIALESTLTIKSPTSTAS